MKVLSTHACTCRRYYDEDVCVCVCVCVCVFVCVCVRERESESVCEREKERERKRESERERERMSENIYCVHASAYVCLCMCVCVCVHVSVRARVWLLLYSSFVWLYSFLLLLNPFDVVKFSLTFRIFIAKASSSNLVKHCLHSTILHTLKVNLMLHMLMDALILTYEWKGLCSGLLLWLSFYIHLAYDLNSWKLTSIL